MGFEQKINYQLNKFPAVRNVYLLIIHVECVRYSHMIGGAVA